MLKKGMPEGLLWLGHTCACACTLLYNYTHTHADTTEQRTTRGCGSTGSQQRAMCTPAHLPVGGSRSGDLPSFHPHKESAKEILTQPPSPQTGESPRRMPSTLTLRGRQHMAHAVVLGNRATATHNEMLTRWAAPPTHRICC